MVNTLDLLARDPGRVKKIVSVMYYGRSGSYLYGSLLDNHPEVLQVPPSALHNFFGIVLAKILDGKKMPEVIKLVYGVVNEFPCLFADTQDYDSLAVEGDTPIGADRREFATRLGHNLTHLSKIQPLNLYDLFVSIHIAYAQAIGREFSCEEPVIVWQQHMPMIPLQRSLVLRALGRDRTVFLTCVRHPLMTFNSHMEHYVKEEKDSYAAHQPMNQLTILAENVSGDYPGAEGHHFAVRFEDIHMEPEEVMRRTAEWLGIKWDTCLLESTIDGKIFGFLKHGIRITGTNPAKGRERKYTILNWIDRLKLRFILRRHFIEWSYKGADSFNEQGTGLKAFLVKRILCHVPLKAQWRAFVDDLAIAFNKFWVNHKKQKEMLLKDVAYKEDTSVPPPLLYVSEKEKEK